MVIKTSENKKSINGKQKNIEFINKYNIFLAVNFETVMSNRILKNVSNYFD
jgi:hypothetical protein